MLIEENTGEKDEVVLPPDTTNHGSETEGKEETTSPEAAAPAKGGDETPVGKTYTQEEVTNMMHERTKDYASMKRDLETYRAFIAEQDEKAKRAPTPAAPPPPASPELDEDDKKFVDYLKKVVPELGRLGKLDETRLGFIERLQQKEEAERNQFVESSEQEVFKFCDTISAKDDAQKAVVRDAVAAAIMNDPKLMEKWERRDASVISDAIKVLETTLGKRSEVAGKQDLSSVKAKVEKIQAPLPKGGIPAPVTKPKVLTEDERVERAWGRLNNKG